MTHADVTKEDQEDLIDMVRQLPDWALDGFIEIMRTMIRSRTDTEVRA